MSLRRVFRPLSAILLTVGLVTIAIGPADAAPPHRSTSSSTHDTGWGFK